MNVFEDFMRDKGFDVESPISAALFRDLVI